MSFKKFNLNQQFSIDYLEFNKNPDIQDLVQTYRMSLFDSFSVCFIIPQCIHDKLDLNITVLCYIILQSHCVRQVQKCIIPFLIIMRVMAHISITKESRAREKQTRFNQNFTADFRNEDSKTQRKLSIFIGTFVV